MDGREHFHSGYEAPEAMAFWFSSNLQLLNICLTEFTVQSKGRVPMYACYRATGGILWPGRAAPAPNLHPLSMLKSFYSKTESESRERDEKHQNILLHFVFAGMQRSFPHTCHDQLGGFIFCGSRGIWLLQPSGTPSSRAELGKALSYSA